MESLIPRS
jgi:hypothetical protein